MSSQRGFFIVLEGLEGAGKTTAISTIKRVLSTCVNEVIVTREPGGTLLGESIRHILKTPVVDESLDPRAELLLFYAARVQLLEKVILPALARGVCVIADRFELSTFAYQGGGRQLPMSLISAISQSCLNGFKPDLTIFLDIKPEVGLARALARSKADRIESESLDFFQRVYESYYAYMQADSSVVCIDASRSLGSVQYKIRDVLMQFLEQRS